MTPPASAAGGGGCPQQGGAGSPRERAGRRSPAGGAGAPACSCCDMWGGVSPGTLRVTRKPSPRDQIRSGGAAPDPRAADPDPLPPPAPRAPTPVARTLAPEARAAGAASTALAASGVSSSQGTGWRLQPRSLTRPPPGRRRPPQARLTAGLPFLRRPVQRLQLGEALEAADRRAPSTNGGTGTLSPGAEWGAPPCRPDAGAGSPPARRPPAESDPPVLEQPVLLDVRASRRRGGGLRPVLPRGLVLCGGAVPVPDPPAAWRLLPSSRPPPLAHTCSPPHPPSRPERPCQPGVAQAQVCAA